MELKIYSNRMKANSKLVSNGTESETNVKLHKRYKNRCKQQCWIFSLLFCTLRNDFQSVNFIAAKFWCFFGDCKKCKFACHLTRVWLDFHDGFFPRWFGRKKNFLWILYIIRGCSLERKSLSNKPFSCTIKDTKTTL